MPQKKKRPTKLAIAPKAAEQTYGAPKGAPETLILFYKKLYVPAETQTAWEERLARLRAVTWMMAPANFRELRTAKREAQEVYAQFRKYNKSNRADCVELVLINNGPRIKRLLTETRVRSLVDAAKLLDAVENVHAAWIHRWEAQEARLKRELANHASWSYAKTKEFLRTSAELHAMDIRSKRW